MGGAWLVERLCGPAAELHARELVGPVRRTVSVFSVERPALVLGSTQPDSHVDRAAVALAGVDLVRRRSGGGAVLVLPEVSLWVDVVVPRGDECWDDDVARATWWLGEAWGAAMADLGVADATVHRGAFAASRWSPLVCFAGLGAGEVSVGGRKLVGISQRRARAGARFQCLVQRRGDLGPLLALLALDAADRAEAGTDLADVATGLDRRPAEVVDALVAHLPEP
jgi:lipoate-protein ligase A